MLAAGSSAPSWVRGLGALGAALALSAVALGCAAETPDDAPPDPCLALPCGAGATCTADGAEPRCACPPGLAGDAVVACVDIDACVDNPCGANATCTDLAAPALGDAAGRNCGCDIGFEGNPVTGCTDIDACEDNPCGANATCTDLAAPALGDAAGRTCACDIGFEGNPVTGCTGIDACAANACGANATCTDLGDASGRTCSCDMGYEGDAVTGCTDINACAANPCGANATCTDLAAPALGDASGRTCSCNAGYEGNAATGCTDINACAANPCGANATCTDLAAPAPGDASGRTCACNTGYEGNAATGCTDIDGCAGEPCAAGVTCTDVAAPNTGFTCGPCPAGQYGDGETCTDCVTVAGCAGAVTCTTAADSACSECGPGTEQLALGAACTDVNECVDVNLCDAEGAYCDNFEGGYQCLCEEGYQDVHEDGSECVLPAGLVYIPPGTFTMGSPTTELGHQTNETQHEVTLTRGFWMQETEVTQGEWTELSGGVNPSCFQTAGSPWCSTASANDTAPVETVNWYSVLGYANALSVSQGLEPCYSVTMTGCTGTGQPGTWQSGAQACTGTGSSVEVTFVGLDCTGYRLPTESEWEYAARAGTTTATYAGNLTATDCTDTTLPLIAWFCGSAGSRTHPVPGKTANNWGLHDMLGNVWEWVWDWYDGTYPGAVTDPLGPSTGSGRVLRGGGWNSFAQGTRAAVRYDVTPYGRGDFLGFRLCRTVSP